LNNIPIAPKKPRIYVPLQLWFLFLWART